jgi:hypothetical protein
VDVVDAVVLLAQAPRLKAIAASAIIAMYFMMSIFPSFLASWHRAAMFVVCRDKTNVFFGTTTLRE